MASQLQEVSTTDLYYICQIVDSVTTSPRAYLRKLEDVFGDMSSSNLVRKFPKWTCFHMFIEEVISSVIFEDAEQALIKPGKYWIDHLLKSNNFDYPAPPFSEFSVYEGYEYLEKLQENELIDRVCEDICKQVFHVLFSNRRTLTAFGCLVGDYVLNTSSAFVPDAFNDKGFLRRASIPTWAKSAVFHRDKGRCVLCKVDLTRQFSQKAKIHYDHIVPLARGGMNCVTNLQLTCSGCNTSKGGRSSRTSHEYESWYDY
ncbi:HNH endonuclease [Roseibium sediminis]|uniref:HNH endonuclease n=1 Tax=Roseibium sediminis TaxID=1775174 RepID=UPI00137634EC|nr:HNH endonuclease [Roseibium sediminis]